MPALLGLDPDSPALPKLCINLQREALEMTRMVDVNGVATEVPYQCAGLTEFCQYEDCVAKQNRAHPERPRATPLDREDPATLRLFVDPDRRAALKGGKTRVHAAWGIAPEHRRECVKCKKAAQSEDVRARDVENTQKKRKCCKWGDCTSQGKNVYCNKHFNAVTAIAQAALAAAEPGVAYDAAAHFALGDARVQADPATKCVPGKVYVLLENRPTSAGAGSSTDPLPAPTTSLERGAL